MLDLFSGTGAASAAMEERGWRVVRVELDPTFPADHRDVRTFTWAGPRPDLVWCSPPCTEFSRESMPWCRTGKPPSLALVEAALRIVASAAPRWWVLENVRGARKWLRPLLGEPFQHCGPVWLWGSPPPMLWPQVRPWKEKLGGRNKARRAAIPYEISRALAIAIERARAAA
ncbi:MAG TPA: DNA cytosine methyltransferase [Myxococcales bacterium]